MASRARMWSIEPEAMAERGILNDSLAGFVLRQRDAAGFFDGLDACCAVAGPAGQNQGDGAGAETSGNRLKQHVPGRPDEMHFFGVRQRQGAAGVDKKMLVGGRQVDMAGAERFALHRLRDGQGNAAAQNLRHLAGLTRAEVLHYHNGGGKVGGQGRENGADGF